ncbi:hypothetical protein [Piscinibacter terrae]|uniref:hypothetical protein n=1 Tax=Piscinibacter terrae TaxID=2496871 RepID=UPI000F5A518A|nr:hypothetical protein [Albitalea terrae]
MLSTTNLADAADHPILLEPYGYEIKGVNYTTQSGPYGSLELKLEKGASTIVLRFEGVHELEIDAGFPHSYMGLEILDVSYLGWEHEKVRVQGFEDSPGIRFWAREVCRVEPASA